MKKFRILYVVTVLVLLSALGIQYVLLHKNTEDFIFIDESLKSVALVKEETVMQICEDIGSLKTLQMGDIYDIDNMEYYVTVEYPDVEGDYTLDGITLKVKISYDSTYKIKPEKDPFIVGMQEALEQTEDAGKQANMQGIIQEQLYYREEQYKNTQKIYETVYVEMAAPENGWSSFNGYAEDYKLLYQYRMNGIEERIPLEEYWIVRSDEEWKQEGKEALGYIE